MSLFNLAWLGRMISFLNYCGFALRLTPDAAAIRIFVILLTLPPPAKSEGIGERYFLDPRTYAAHIKQCARWEADGASVIWRPLRYPPRRTGLPPQEEGIDVALCIDFVAMAIDGLYAVADPTDYNQ